MKQRILAILAVVLVAGGTASADAPATAGARAPAAQGALSDLLPADTLAFLELNPGALPQAKAPPALIDMGLQALQTVGILGDKGGEAADAVGLAGELGTTRSCLAWLDAELAPANAQPQTDLTQPLPFARLQCKSVQLVWILEIDNPSDLQGMAGGAGARLTRLLSHFATRATVRQSVKAAAESRKEFVEFHDSRWPEWLTLAWTQEPATPSSRPRLVVALGAGAMEHYLADRPVAELPWKHAADVADGPAPAPDPPLARLCVAVKEFRSRFPDAMRRTMLGRLFAGLDLGGTDYSLFTARAQAPDPSQPASPRALSMGTASQDGAGNVTLTPWTVELPPGTALLKAVPSAANVYMVLRIQWQDLYRRTMAVCDAALTDPTDKPVERVISDLAAAQGVDLQKDLLARLEPLVLVHDFPQHPLQLPLMVTIVAAAEPGSQAKATAAVSKLTAAASAALEKKADAPKPEPEIPSTMPAPKEGDFTRLRIRTDKDGISYLQFGLVGPGWGWYENRLVISWSPGAVRANAAAAGRVPSSAFALPVTSRPRQGPW